MKRPNAESWRYRRSGDARERVSLPNKPAERVAHEAQQYVRWDSPQAMMAAARSQHWAFERPSSVSDRFFERLVDGEVFDAPARLAAASLFTAEHVLLQHELADWRDVPDTLRLFASCFCELLRRMQVPVYVRRSTPSELVILHCRYHGDLTPQEFQLLQALGMRLSIKLGLPVLGVSGTRWYLPPEFVQRGPWHPLLPPVRFTPRGLLTANRLSFGGAG